MPSSLLDRKETHFVLWRPGAQEPPPKLVIGVGVFKAGSPALLAEERAIPMAPAGESGELWELPAASLGLREGQVYHYWFEVPDTAPFRSPSTPLRCTDPAAYAVDWRLRANGGDNDAAAAIIRWRNGKLVPSDAAGEPMLFDPAAAPRRATCRWRACRPTTDWSSTSCPRRGRRPAIWSMRTTSASGRSATCRR